MNKQLKFACLFCLKSNRILFSIFFSTNGKCWGVKCSNVDYLPLDMNCILLLLLLFNSLSMGSAKPLPKLVKCVNIVLT